MTERKRYGNLDAVRAVSLVIAALIHRLLGESCEDTACK
jgi:hypothetical protein